MLLSIRSEQMAVIEGVAQENFVRRIADHLRLNYPKAAVKLPGEENYTVDGLPEITLFTLIRSGIRRARTYQMDFESSIAGFVAVMFEVAPNFDTHRLSQVLLNDDEVDPNQRLTELLKVLTEKNWESIRHDYDPGAWAFVETDADADKASDEAPDEKPSTADLDATVLNL